MLKKLYTKVISKLFSEMQRQQLRYIEELYMTAPNVTLGCNVKFPYVKNGPPRYGKIKIGNNSWMCGTINIFPHNVEAEVKIGEDCYIGDDTRIWCAKSIIIGDRVLIAHNVNIFDTATHPLDKIERYTHEKLVKEHGMPIILNQKIPEAAVIIHDDVWIGCNSIILKGVEIGEGSIIGAGSVVTKNVPPNTLVGGNPARVVKVLQKERI